MLLMKESVFSLKEKTTRYWLSYFSTSLTIFMPPFEEPVSSYRKTTGMQTSGPMSMINISCITCFVIVVK